MKKQVRGGSALFLLELMISMLFFSVTAACCVQVFAKAHLMSQKANNLSMAVSYASNAAELLNHLDDGEALSEKLNGCERTMQDRYQVWYDENWQVCEAADAYAGMEILVSEEKGLRKGSILVTICEEEEVLYSLEAGCFEAAYRGSR